MVNELTPVEVLHEIADGLLELDPRDPSRAFRHDDEVQIEFQVRNWKEPYLKESYRIVGPWPEHSWVGLDGVRLNWQPNQSANPRTPPEWALYTPIQRVRKPQPRRIADARRRIAAMATAGTIEESAIAALRGDPLFLECQEDQDFRAWATIGTLARAKRVGHFSIADLQYLAAAFDEALKGFFSVRRGGLWASSNTVPAQIRFVTHQALHTAAMIALEISPRADPTPWETDTQGLW